MAEIVITEFMDADVVAEVLAGRDVVYDPTLVDQPEALLAAVADARALIVRNRTQVRGALLDAAAKLEVVGRLGVGLDNIDLDACKARGIAVSPATGANDLSVAEYVVTAALVLLRGVYAATDQVAAGAWPRTQLMGREAAGKQMGLVGFGAIAREVATRARALGMSVAAFDPYVEASDPAWLDAEQREFGALLESSDVISLHVPLTQETRHLIDAGALAGMKPGAILINAARGGIVDEAELAAALKEDRLSGAALDVFEAEPVTAETGAKFRDVPNLILTPHIAGVTAESNLRVSRLTAETVVAHLDGA